MKRNAKRLMPLAVVVCLVFWGHLGLSGETVPEAVTQSAQKGLQEVISAGASMDGSPSGVSGKAALENVQLGQGFRVYTVAPVELLNNTRLAPAVKATGMWRFVVTEQNKPVSLLTVAMVEGQWRAVSIGAGQLAAEFSRVMAQWPTQSGYSHRFIRSYQAKADFIEVTREGKAMGFVPLSASRVAFGLDGAFDAGMLMHPSEILSPLQSLVAEELGRKGNLSRN